MNTKTRTVPYGYHENDIGIYTSEMISRLDSNLDYFEPHHNILWQSPRELDHTRIQKEVTHEIIYL